MIKMIYFISSCDFDKFSFCFRMVAFVWMPNIKNEIVIVNTMRALNY